MRNSSPPISKPRAVPDLRVTREPSSTAEASIERAPVLRDADGLVTIYNADSTDLRFLAPESVHLVVTSPPYNLGKDYGTARDDATYHQYLDWVVSWCRQLWRVLEAGGRLCLNISLDINLSFDAGGKLLTQKRPGPEELPDPLLQK